MTERVRILNESQQRKYWRSLATEARSNPCESGVSRALCVSSDSVIAFLNTTVI